MRIFKEQCSRYGGAGSDRKQSIPPGPATVTSIHQQQGDRGSSDDTAARCLPVFVRYRDLETAGIVANWPTLLRMIAEEGFPTGVMLSPNIRAWRIDTIEEWLATRPTERKPVTPASKPRGRSRRAAAAS